MEQIQSGMKVDTQYTPYATGTSKGKGDDRRIPGDGFKETPRKEALDSEKLKELKARVLVENLTHDDGTSKAIEQHRGLRKSLISNMTAIVAGVVLAIVADRVARR